MKKYPILHSNKDYIPYDMMLEHEQQCIYNHGQTVQRLSERGGTSYSETLFILKNRSFDDTLVNQYEKNNKRSFEDEARKTVHAIAYQWLVEHNELD